jgi:hypothetical protein
MVGSHGFPEHVFQPDEPASGVLNVLVLRVSESYGDKNTPWHFPLVLKRSSLDDDTYEPVGLLHETSPDFVWPEEEEEFHTITIK